MKEFTGCSINISMIELQSGGFTPNAEIVLVVSEPTYTISLGGELIRQRTIDHFRFAATTGSLRQLIKNLTEYADEMDGTSARFPPEKLVSDS